MLCFFFFLISFSTADLFEERICEAKEEANDRVLKGIRGAASWQRRFSGVVGLRMVLEARRTSWCGSSGVVERGNSSMMRG